MDYGEILVTPEQVTQLKKLNEINMRYAADKLYGEVVVKWEAGKVVIVRKTENELI